MALYEDFTQYLALPLPHPDNELEEDVSRLRDAFSAVDVELHGAKSDLLEKRDKSDTIEVVDGGTGATSAADARANLDVPGRNGEGATGEWPIDISGRATAVPFDGIEDRPTTLAGYGFADAQIKLSIQVKNAAFVAVNGGRYSCDTSAGAFTMTLPATPQAGWEVEVLDHAGSFDTKNLTVARNGANMLGVADDYVLDQRYRGRTFVYVNAVKGWLVQ